ncbi:MAG: hypothetical protein KKD94_00880, partial [Nanoarchaeota archaeon]|nr:hypothetical protein [Nanoarchaeota archaeon]
MNCLRKIVLICVSIALVVSVFPIRAAKAEDQLPQITYPSQNQVFQVGVNTHFTLQIQAYDPEGKNIIYVLSTYPNDLILDQNSGMITWTPDDRFLGKRYEVKFYVSDRPLGSAVPREVFRTFYIEVSSEDRLPIITQPRENEVFRVRVGESFNYQIQASDPEGQQLLYHASSRPSSLQLDQNTGRITWIPDQ